jgi:hypothetical protein
MPAYLFRLISLTILFDFEIESTNKIKIFDVFKINFSHLIFNVPEISQRFHIHFVEFPIVLDIRPNFQHRQRALNGIDVPSIFVFRCYPVRRPEF